MSSDMVDRLLQLAYLEGIIGTRGLYERSVERQAHPVQVSSQQRDALLRRLAEGLGIVEIRTDSTIGVYLRTVRSAVSSRPAELFARLGLQSNVYKMLERDRISPLKVSAENWRKFQAFFKLSAEELAGMLRRTHQVVFFRPSFRTVLARYDSRKNKAMKLPTLDRASTELFARAELTLPRNEAEKIDRLVQALHDSP